MDDGVQEFGPPPDGYDWIVQTNDPMKIAE
jgi:hypothetical protein